MRGPRQQEIYEHARKIVDANAAARLTPQAEEALWLLDKKRLPEVVAEADRVKWSNADLDDIRYHLRQPRGSSSSCRSSGSKRDEGPKPIGKPRASAAKALRDCRRRRAEPRLLPKNAAEEAMRTQLGKVDRGGGVANEPWPKCMGIRATRHLSLTGGTGIFQRHNFEGMWTHGGARRDPGGHPTAEHRTPNGQIVHLFRELCVQRAPRSVIGPVPGNENGWGFVDLSATHPELISEKWMVWMETSWEESKRLNFRGLENGAHGDWASMVEEDEEDEEDEDDHEGARGVQGEEEAIEEGERNGRRRRRARPRRRRAQARRRPRAAPNPRKRDDAAQSRSRSRGRV